MLKYYLLYFGALLIKVTNYAPIMLKIYHKFIPILYWFHFLWGFQVSARC